MAKSVMNNKFAAFLIGFLFVTFLMISTFHMGSVDAVDESTCLGSGGIPNNLGVGLCLNCDEDNQCNDCKQQCEDLMPGFKTDSSCDPVVDADFPLKTCGCCSHQ